MPADKPTPTVEQFARELVAKFTKIIAGHREYGDKHAIGQWCWALLEIKELTAAHGIKLEEGGE